MSNKHTLGGWNRNIKPASKYNVIYAGRNTHVAKLCTEGLTEEEIEANCNLIAAAPDLLIALKELYNKVKKDSDVGDCRGTAYLWLDDALAAINKAAGNV